MEEREQEEDEEAKARGRHDDELELIDLYKVCFYIRQEDSCRRAMANPSSSEVTKRIWCLMEYSRCSKCAMYGQDEHLTVSCTGLELIRTRICEQALR